MKAAKPVIKNTREPLPPGFIRQWILYCGIAEFLGIAFAATVTVLMMNSQEPSGFWVWGLPFLLAVVVGGVEGMIVGRLQWLVLRRKYSKITPFSWMGITALAAITAWMLGLLPSTIAESTQVEPSEPGFLLMLGMGAVMGLALGALFGLFQRYVLTEFVHRSHLWIVGNAFGWMVGMTLIFAGAALVEAHWPVWLIGLTAGCSGLLAGFTVGVATGLVFPKMPLKKPEEREKEKLQNVVSLEESTAG